MSAPLGGETVVSPLPRSRQGVLPRIPWAELVFMAPAAALVLIFFFTPVVLTLYTSLTDMSTATGLSRYSFIGLENYAQMLSSPWTGKILANTALYASVTLTFNVCVGLLIALLTTHVDDSVGTTFRMLWLLPRITPSVVYALLWRWTTADAPYGIVNQLISPLGVPPDNWLNATPWPVVFLMNGFVGASLGMIVFTSAIRAIPRDLIIAARVDGATTLQIVRRITLPLLRWPILFVTSYQTLSLITSFEYILLTTDGGPGFYTTEVWALYAYHRALSNYAGNTQFGFGAALAAVLVLIGIIAALIYLRVFRFNDLVSEPKIERV